MYFVTSFPVPYVTESSWRPLHSAATPSTRATSTIWSGFVRSFLLTKAKGLRTNVRAGDNPGMGPYNGDLVCITRQDGKTIMACHYD